MKLTVFQPRLLEIDSLDLPCTCPACGEEVYLLLRDKGVGLAVHSGLSMCLLDAPDIPNED